MPPVTEVQQHRYERLKIDFACFPLATIDAYFELELLMSTDEELIEPRIIDEHLANVAWDVVLENPLFENTWLGLVLGKMCYLVIEKGLSSSRCIQILNALAKAAPPSAWGTRIPLPKISSPFLVLLAILDRLYDQAYFECLLVVVDKLKSDSTIWASCIIEAGIKQPTPWRLISLLLKRHPTLPLFDRMVQVNKTLPTECWLNCYTLKSGKNTPIVSLWLEIFSLHAAILPLDRIHEFVQSIPAIAFTFLHPFSSKDGLVLPVHYLLGMIKENPANRALLIVAEHLSNNIPAEQWDFLAKINAEPTSLMLVSTLLLSHRGMASVFRAFLRNSTSADWCQSPTEGKTLLLNLLLALQIFPTDLDLWGILEAIIDKLPLTIWASPMLAMAGGREVKNDLMFYFIQLMTHINTPHELLIPCLYKLPFSLWTQFIKRGLFASVSPLQELIGNLSERPTPREWLPFLHHILKHINLTSVTREQSGAYMKTCLYYIDTVSRDPAYVHLNDFIVGFIKKIDLETWTSTILINKKMTTRFNQLIDIIERSSDEMPHTAALAVLEQLAQTIEPEQLEAPIDERLPHPLNRLIELLLQNRMMPLLNIVRVALTRATPEARATVNKTLKNRLDASGSDQFKVISALLVPQKKEVMKASSLNAKLVTAPVGLKKATSARASVGTTTPKSIKPVSTKLTPVSAAQSTVSSEKMRAHLHSFLTDPSDDKRYTQLQQAVAVWDNAGLIDGKSLLFCLMTMIYTLHQSPSVHRLYALIHDLLRPSFPLEQWFTQVEANGCLWTPFIMLADLLYYEKVSHPDFIQLLHHAIDTAPKDAWLTPRIQIMPRSAAESQDLKEDSVFHLLTQTLGRQCDTIEWVDLVVRALAKMQGHRVEHAVHEALMPQLIVLSEFMTDAQMNPVLPKEVREAYLVLKSHLRKSPPSSNHVSTSSAAFFSPQQQQDLSKKAEALVP